MALSKNVFFDNYIFIHTHIEKCGGSTLLQHMTTLLGNQHVYDLRTPPVTTEKTLLKRYPEIKKRLPDIRLLSGHIWYNTPWTKFFPNSRWASKLLSPVRFSYCRKQPLYIASIRHPIDRLNSLFRYIKANPSHAEYKNNSRNDNLDQFVQDLIAKDAIKSKNALCMQITHCRDPLHLLEKAKNAFDHHYLAIVPYNKTHELANMLAEVLELPQVENCVINSNTVKETAAFSKETLAILEERYSDDIQLYDYICKGYHAKLIKAKAQLHGLLHSF